VYSQWQRRNVAKDEFKSDLDQFESESID
jgi:hypothetical protein